MKFIHKIKADDFINNNNNFDSNDYMGIKFYMMSEIFENNIGLFIQVKLPYGYEKIDTKIRCGILNSNSNMCNKHIFEYTYSHNECEAIGTKTFISKAGVNKYIINNYIYVGFEIVNCEYEKNHIRMIQKIYEIINKNDNSNELDILKYQLDESKKDCDKYKNNNKVFNVKNDKLRKAYDDLLFKFNELKKDLELRNQYINNLNENIEVLNIAIEEMKKEIKYYNPKSNVDNYIEVEQEIENDDDSINRINIYKNSLDNIYNVNILDLDKVEIKDFSLYDLKVFKKKLNRLQCIIDDKIQDQESCKICFTNDIDVILLPCGHSCCCSNCSQFINKKCPICRKQVDNLYKIY